MLCVNLMTTQVRNKLAITRWRERNPNYAHAHYVKVRDIVLAERHTERVRVAERIRARKYRAENPEKFRERDRARRAADPEKFRERDRKRNESRREYTKERRRINPERFHGYDIANHARRRARELGNGGAFTAQQFADLCSSYGNRCLCCKRTERELNQLGLLLVPDHVLPLVKGGSSDIGNIQPLCHGKGGCNNRKKDKHIAYREGADGKS